jgi:hypothetical protein
MRRTRGAVICMRCYGSSKGRVVTANVALSAATPRLPDNLSNFIQIATLKKTDVLTYSFRLRLAV